MATRGWTYQPALDGLRAVAVAAVVAYHLDASWAPGGFLGVDAFFVLSGFLITSLLLAEWARSKTISLSTFWARRARRLLPALLLVLLAVAVYAQWSARPETLGRLRGDMFSTLFYGANWRFISSGQSYFDLFSEASPLRHTWSLAIEEQFYLVWPLVTLACLRLARGRTWLLGTVCAVGTAASAFTMAQLFDAGDPSRAYYGTDSRAQLLFVGALLAIALTRWSPERSSAATRTTHVLGVIGALYVVWSFARVHDTDAWMYRGGSFVFAIAVAALIVSVVQPTSTPLRSVLALAPFVWLGRISYGIYLWHWPVIVVASPSRTDLNGASLTLLRIALTLAFATASFYLVELPIRERRMLSGRLALAASPAAFVACAVVVIFATQGARPLPAYYRAEPTHIVRGETAAGAVPGAVQPPRVLLVGDSVATSLLPGLNEVGSAAGLELSAVAFPGCGVVRGMPAGANGRPIEGLGEKCDTAVPELHENTIATVQPDLVVWLSTFEMMDRIVDGQWLHVGTGEGNAGYAALVEETADRLRARGARLVILLPALPNPGGWLPDYPYDQRVWRVQTLIQLLTEQAALHPDTTSTIDLAPIVCPGGSPCPEEVDGIRLRPDGSHFEVDGARYVAERVVPQIRATLPTAASAR